MAVSQTGMFDHRLVEMGHRNFAAAPTAPLAEAEEGRKLLPPPDGAAGGRPSPSARRHRSGGATFRFRVVLMEIPP